MVWTIGCVRFSSAICSVVILLRERGPAGKGAPVMITITAWVALAISHTPLLVHCWPKGVLFFSRYGVLVMSDTNKEPTPPANVNPTAVIPKGHTSFIVARTLYIVSICLSCVSIFGTFLASEDDGCGCFSAIFLTLSMLFLYLPILLWIVGTAFLIFGFSSQRKFTPRRLTLASISLFVLLLTWLFIEYTGKQLDETAFGKGFGAGVQTLGELSEAAQVK